jgi:hypothetical protein
MTIPQIEDAETRSLATRVFEAAWGELQSLLVVEPLDPSGLRSALASRILNALKAGERDPERLRLLALRAIDA